MDNICITMPKNLRDFLVSIPASQDYQIQLILGAHKKQREENFQVTFRMEERFQYFESVLQVVKDRVPVFDYSGWEECSRGDYDCFIDMDLKRAADITRNSRMHMAQAIGIMIGAGPAKWPVMRALQLKQPEIQSDLLVTNWGDAKQAKKFVYFLERNYPDLNVVYDDRDLSTYEDTPELMVEYVQLFKAIIAKSGALTYLAATLKKVVFEVFNSYEEMVLFNNVGLQVYQQMIGNPTADTMWRLWEERWADFSRECLSDTSNPGSITTGQPQSTAANVEEKSSG